MRAARVLVLAAILLPVAQALDLPGIEPPLADFVWSDPLPREPVTFTSTSQAHDRPILLLEWSFEGSEPGLLPTTGEEVEHVFARPGDYRVTLTARDATLGAGKVTKLVSVPNTPPVAAIEITPSPAFRGQEVLFQDVSSDADGDAIVNATWTIGGYGYHGHEARHVFGTIGIHHIELVVRDAREAEARTAMELRVLNRAPEVTADWSPHAPRAGETVTFRAAGVDPDTGGPVTFEWAFSDGTRASGATYARTFASNGEYAVKLIGRDADGGLSAPWTRGITVRDP